MGLFSKTAPEGDIATVVPEVADEKGNAQSDAAANSEDHDLSDDVDKDAQHGVQGIEAAAKVWSLQHMIAAYIIIWLIYFVTSIEEVVTGALNPFVTSSFQQHSLTAATGIIASLFGGLSKLPLAKILDTWGRPQGLLLTLFLWVIGFIMMAACNNVETYAAAQVFSSIGSQGVSYCITVFIADTTSLLNRPLMLAYATSPYVGTTFAGGPISDSVIAHIGWRWGFGIWAIVTPVVVGPLGGLFIWNHLKARKQGLLESKSGRLTFASIKKYCIDVDLIGILILATGMALFLLSFSIYSYQAEQWRAPIIISFIVVGGLLIIAFGLYEAYLAPVKFIPIKLLMDRTVFFGGLMFLFVFTNSAIWGSYFSSMLLVVWNTGITKATYINNIYRVGSCFAAPILGFFIRLTGRFKWTATLYALPLMLLGVGLMIHFRQPDQSIGYVVLTQIFVAFAGGPMVVAGEMAMMAPSDHQHVAVILAILDLFSSIGYALGSTISAAIWTGTFKKNLIKYLPADAPVDEIFGSLYTQLGYPEGTDIRHQISLAYGDSQRIMLIASVSFIAIGWGCTWMWRDIKLRDVKQTRGHVI
ncbi:major facilitator superfamily transporter [Trichoderma cornu-damae]|uniref:Major facilitator superfamily transporter n=1 Tax=Trichoderma cornu-damae TaxID=654480 RepID=A0A9P8QV18_9HYPO|nr:major facilitator superfamily transporter [Trichoderma cornu-damae]